MLFRSSKKFSPGTVKQRIARRLRSMTGMGEIARASVYPVQLVNYQRSGEMALETGDIVLHFPSSVSFSSQTETDLSSKNCESIVKFDDTESERKLESPEQVQIVEPNEVTLRKE